MSKAKGDPGYEAWKEKQAKISRDRSASGRDIGPLPAVADPERKAACRASLRLFCETYLAGKFPLKWSDDHLKALDRLQTCVLDGGRFAFAMPRGSGKTTMAQAAAAWAVLYAHRSFVVVIGATETHAEELLDELKVELETNDLLAGDFPEVCHPIRSLDGIANRANGQTLGGERTRIGWTQKELVLPTVAGMPTSGTVLRVAGITGRIRGMKASTADGKSIRPDLVILDDPQTDDSATSPAQNAHREKVIAGAVLGLAGPKKKISAVMPCTVIAPGDMIDRVLDRDRHPAWNGERMRLVYSFPDAVALWDEYAELRRSGLRAGDAGAAATEFYRERREEMDAGAVVAWAERFNPDEISAVQFAMNLRIDNPRAFAAEYQNEPVADADETPAAALTPDLVAARVGPTPRFTVPRDATRLTAFVDVGGLVHWYAVVAWTEAFGGVLVDYGAWPKQNRAYFAAADARPSLADLHPGLTEPQRVYAGLRDLTAAVIGRDYKREGVGDIIRVERCLIDSGWLPDTVHQFCRESPFTAIIYPSKGHAAGSNSRPIREWKVLPGQRAGRDWRLSLPEKGRGRAVIFDPDSWKSFIVDRLTTPPGGGGDLHLFAGPAGSHQLLADHLSAEYATRVTAKGRTYDQWRAKPGADNHLFDCLVGSAVAASVAGLAWSDAGTAAPGERPPTTRQKLSDIQARKRAAAGR